MASDNLDFQVAAFLIQNPSLYSSLLSRLEIPFGSKMVRGVWSILRSTWKKHGEFPTREGCMELLANHPKVDSRPEILRMLNEAVCEIYDLSAQGSATKEVILSRILDNYKWQLKEQLDSMGLDNITDKVLELSQEVHKLESFLKGGEEDWIFPLSTAHLENPLELLFNLQGDPIPTGIAPLDEWMNGGPRRKESMMVIGITDQGKSMLVNSFAGDNIRQGCRSAVYILDSPEADVFSKFWANFSGVGIEDNKVASEFSTRLMRNVREEWRGQLACRVWTRGTKTIDDVRRDLDALTKYYYKKDVAAGMDPGEAGVIDTVYIDHMECLAPKGKAKEDWLNSGGLADGIDQIAKDYNVFVMAPTQAKQGATRLDIVDMTEASRAWGKNHPMTHVVGLCRSASEVHQGIGRLYMAKSKRTRSHYIVPVRMDRHTQRVYENGPVYYPEFGGGNKEGEKKAMRGKPVDTSKPPTRDFPPKYANGKQKVKKGCEEVDKDPGLFQ